MMSVLCFITVLLLMPSIKALDEQTICNNISDLNRSNCTLVTLSRDQRVDGKIEIFSSIAIKAVGNEQINVTCLKEARFVFNNIQSAVIENVAFISCGEELNASAGVEISNVSNVELINVTISNSSNSALKIEGSNDVSLRNLIIENNHLVTDAITDHYSVVSIVNCHRVQFHGNSTFFNNGFYINSSATSDTDVTFCTHHIQAILFVDSSIVSISGQFLVEENIGPSGIIHFTNIMVQANDLVAIFAKNRPCINGALYLKSTNASFSGDFTFQDNFASEYFLRYEDVRSVASINLLQQSSFHLNGSLTFEQNAGDVTSLFIQDKSRVQVTGILEILNHKHGYAGIFLKSESALILNGIGRFWNNTFHNSVIRQERSRLRTYGNMSFENNSGNSPCVFRVRSSAEINGTIMFRNNSGVLYLVDSTTTIDGVSSFMYNNIHDFGIGGAIAMFRSKLSLSGNYLFEGNSVNDVDGGVIYGHISTLIFMGNGSFIGNSARYGGAIYLQNKPMIQLREETTIRFMNNTAIKGGAFYIFGSLDTFQCINNTEVSIETPPCFIDLQNSIDDHSLIFRNNTGKEGGSILQLKVVEDFNLAEQGTNILTSCDNCALSVFTRDKSKTNSIPLLSSDTIRLCFCRDNKPDCTQDHQSVRVIRGQQFSISMTVLTFDLFRANQSHIIRSYFESLEDDKMRNFNGNSQPLEEGCNPLTYTLETTSDKEVIIISADESCEVSNAQLSMTVTFDNCPEGFSISDGKCVCDERIKQFLESCDVNNKTVTKKVSNINTWIKPYFSNQTNTYIGMIYYEHCPVDYCSSSVVEVFPLDPDSQCNHSHAGIVCGKCRDGYSRILGSSKCETCSNWHLFLLLPIGILGILLICFLFLTQLTVATGTIHGLVLYANIVNAYRSVFFPGPDHFFEAYTVFISWLNLDFGIETCFYNGLDQLSYSGWQFVFPIYLWIIVGFIVIICHWSVRLSKIFGSSDPVAVLATIILLSYNKLLQNVIEIFTVAYLSYPPNATNVNSIAWYLDSNITYGEGAHLILCIVALVVTILLFLPYTLVLVFAQLLQKSNFISACLQRLRLTPFIKVYQAPYKSSTRFWIGLCLLLRCALLITYASADNSSIGLLATAILCFLLVGIIVVFRGVYSKHRLDVLEVSFIINLGILSLVTYHFLNADINIKPLAPAYISVSIAFITFLGIVISQIVWRLKKFSKIEKITGKVKDKVIKPSKRLSEESPIKKNTMEARSGLVTTQDLVMLDESFQLELREPLLDEAVTSHKKH